MAAPKLRNKWGLTGAIESPYGTWADPANSAGVLLVEPVEPTEEPLNDGARVGRAPGTGGSWARVAPSAFGSAFEAVTEAIGGGAAYSASVKPSVDLFLRILGLEATLDATGGAEKYTYAPESGPTGFDSASFKTFIRGQQYQTRGAYAAEAVAEFDGPAVPRWAFSVQGIRNAAPQDTALPAITGYPAGTLLPPKAQALSLNVGGVTSLILRGGRVTISRELTPRGDASGSSQHAGFSPGRRTIGLELTVEAIALATFNPYTIRDAATLQQITFAVGATQYNRYDFDFPQAQLMEAEEGEDGATAIWTLTYEAKVSTPTAEDDLILTFD